MHRALDQRDQPHQGDAQSRAEQAEDRIKHVIGRADRVHAAGRDHIGRHAHRAGQHRGGERGEHHRGDGGGAIGAEHHFEGVEGAGERGAECGADRRARAGGHQRAQVAPPELDPLPEQRCQAAAGLGIGRLEPHRGAEAVGEQGGADHHGGVARGDAAAVQRIGLDNVDRLAPAQAP